MKFYSGIGSRETPDNILSLMEEFAMWAATHGYALRSGAAEGADSAFERGCIQRGGKMEIYLPSPGWRGRRGAEYFPPIEGDTRAMDMASEILPHWRGLKHFARLLHARNCHQVLGQDLATPSKVVICYTPDAVEAEDKIVIGRTGGTATAIRLACRHSIPVWNLCREERVVALRERMAGAA